VSCAHHGVLCLQNVHEYAPAILDGLSQPLDHGHIRIDRAAASVTLPARFLLIATAYRCLCDQTICVCSPNAKQRYQRRLSGPIMNRFELRITTEKPTPNANPYRWSTAEARDRVARARHRAMDRQNCLNRDLTDEQLDNVAQLSDTSNETIEQALRVGTLSHRSINKIRRVARTIADLYDDPTKLLDDEDVTTAMQMHHLTPTSTNIELSI
jgi:magnesium chelatase family protein